MHIRLLEQADIEAAVALIERMLQEGEAHRGIRFVPAAMRTWLFSAVTMPDDFFCVVAVDDGERVVGGFLGCKQPFLFSSEQMALEFGLYLIPEKRGGFTAVRLIKRFEQWAKDQGCRRIQVGATVGTNDQLAANIYRKLGFRDSGPLLCKELR